MPTSNRESSDPHEPQGTNRAACDAAPHRRIRVEQSHRKGHKPRDQKTLRTTGCLRVFSDPCPSCSSRVESASHPGQWLQQRQPYVRCPHRHKRILPGPGLGVETAVVPCPTFAWARAGRKVCAEAATAQLGLRHAAEATSASAGGTEKATVLGSNTAATWRPQMRARAPSADVPLGITMSNKR
ncbi:hypothetical protein OPT61_g8635 [Boeremia exigua]|uniref:Uncharacterized protein n=1 Tax=Boeremia exigua TaxID=749465 RepID=A0ACC2HXU8_9PLEO|nr:hypothetical protein OPT61_g8635 [Boeremia exigua]